MCNIPADERSIRDEEVFAALDLTNPGMEGVRIALEQNDISGAKTKLIRYFETRSSPHFFFDYRKLPLMKIDTDSSPHDFQSSLGLSGSLKEFCLYAGKQLMKHIYVRPGRDRIEIDLGAQYENLPHFNYLKDLGKKHRTIMDIFVRGQMFEYLAVLYHETNDKRVLAQFGETLAVFLENYPLVVEYTKPDASRFCLTEDRDVMSVGWLVMQYTSLLYTRIPYEIHPDLAFEIIKRIWYLGIQFSRLEHDTYRKYNHHMWERGLMPYMLGVLFPEIPAFAARTERGASVICQHVRDDFNEAGGYSEHSIPYWSGAALCEMLYRGIYLARANGLSLLDTESQRRIDLTFSALALISPPQELYSSLGDNGGPMVDPILHIGEKATDNVFCREVLAVRKGETEVPRIFVPLDFGNDQCGFACSRSSFRRNANFMLLSAKVNCGDTGHNHMDMLSLFITFRGQELIGEPHARQLYHGVRVGSDHRGYMYNMDSHNTVLAYGNPVQPNCMYADKWGVYRPDSPISAFQSTEEGSFVGAYHDAYTTCRHNRNVLFHRRRGLIIHDVIEHGNRLPAAHIQRWNLLPDVHCRQLDARAVLLEKQGVRVLCLWTGSPAISLWKKEDLYPEIVKDYTQLSTIMDASFCAGQEKAEDIAEVSQALLFLDVTDCLPGLDEFDSMSAAITAILAEPDKKTALNLFSRL